MEEEGEGLFYSENSSGWTDEERTKAELVRKLLDKSNPGTDAKWIVTQASILLEYIKPK